MIAYGDELLVVGRVFFAAVFLYNGYNNVTDSGMVDYAQYKGLPSAPILTRLSGVVIFLAGLGILLGAYVAVSAIALVLFLLVSALIFHDFWSIEDPEERVNQLNHFLKNVAMAGGGIAFLVLADTTWAYALNVGLV